VIILSSFIDKPGQFASWLIHRQWAEWEIITIAVVAVFVVFWIIRLQRKRPYRNIYGNKFLESTPVIGAKLGSRKRRRHIIKDFKKAQLAAAQHGHANQQKSTKQSESEKLHEQIRQLQREIIIRKQSEVRLEEKVAYLTSVNEKLKLELTEQKQTKQSAKTKDEVQPTLEEELRPEISEEKPSEQPIAQEPFSEETEQPVIFESEQVEQYLGEQSADAPIEKELVERRKYPRRSKKYEDFHRVVDNVKQKLCRKCNEWKPESEFYKNASSKDGLAGTCKTCKAEAAKEYRRRRKSAQD
jgi:hypothetical protein